jgi:type I restriction enzyme S subunit
MIDKSTIPGHWDIKKIEDVCRKISLNKIKTRQKEYLSQGLFPVVDQGIELIGGYSNEARFIIPEEPPYIIFGDHTKIKKFINFKFIPGADGVKVLKSSPNIDPKFLYYSLHIVKIPDKGYARHFQFLEKEEIPVPPLSEQHQIVSKIEELFSELDKGKHQLQSVLQLLKVYRQSLFKSNFKGKKLISFEEFVESSQNGLSKRKGISGEEFKVLRLADITNNKINDSDPRTILMDENEINKYKVIEDDLICVRVNGSKDLVGKLIHVSNKNEKDNWAYCDHFIKFRLKSSKAYAKFFHYYFSTLEVRKYIQDNMVTSAGQNTVSQVTIKNVMVPYFTKNEQENIVKELENKFSLCEMIEESINQSLQQTELLRQSILKQAFEGKLVKPKS